MSLVIVLSAPLKKLRIHEWTRLLYFRGKYFLYKFFQSSKVWNLYYNYNQHPHCVWWIYLFTYHPDFGDCYFALYTSQKSCSVSCQCWWHLLKSCPPSFSLPTTSTLPSIVDLFVVFACIKYISKKFMDERIWSTFL